MHLVKVFPCYGVRRMAEYTILRCMNAMPFHMLCSLLGGVQSLQPWDEWHVMHLSTGDRLASAGWVPHRFVPCSPTPFTRFKGCISLIVYHATFWATVNSLVIQPQLLHSPFNNTEVLWNAVWSWSRLLHETYYIVEAAM